MENFPSECDMKNVVKELTQGRELARQLQSHFNAESSSNETRDFLLYKILSSYDRALSMIKLNEALPAVTTVDDSPRSHTTSPCSDYSDQEVKDQASRKRKLVRWTQKIQVCPGRGMEGLLDDGYCWRKYGQKDILGAKFPRGYYRCTHRYGQGCLATRQVQKSDEDPTMFDVTYRGRHTCNLVGNSSNNNPIISMPNSQNEDPPENPHQLVNQPQLNPQDEPLLNIQTSLRVTTHDLDTNANPTFDPFYISSSSSIDPGNYLDNYPSSFISPATSEINYFTSSPSLINDTYCELNRIVDATTSATSTSTVGPNSTFGSAGLGSNFSFGGYFP